MWIRRYVCIEVESANTISIVHTNLIAPIIIKNCQEEFQHFTDLQEPVIYGRLSEQCVVDHPLIQVQWLTDLQLTVT